MNSTIIALAHRRFRLGVFFVALSAICFCAAPRVQAGLTMEMNVIRYHQYGYYFHPNLNTNSTAPSVPFGDYFVASSAYPSNGSSALYRFNASGFNQISGGSSGYGDFDGMIHQLTNGAWSIYVTNSVTTNLYHFTVTANISSNDLPYVNITSPPDGSVNVTNQPTFTWQGPTNYNALVVYYFNGGDFLPVAQTSLLSPRVLYKGINSFTAHYDSNSTTAVVSSVPLDNASQPISSWVSKAHLQDYSSSQFTVGTVDPSSTSHTLVAHYPFDATSGPVLNAAVDTSGNGYDMDFEGEFGSQGGGNLTSDSAAGAGAVQFHNGNASSAGYLGWSNPTPPALLSALAGSFSISCWIKTTQNFNYWDDSPAFYGAGIVSADNGGLANDLVPLALTGSKIGFNTGGDEDVTVNSSAAINDGNYHHIVVTRNLATSQKIIYVDGVLDSFSSGTADLLSDPQKLTIGALADASDPDPNNFNYYNGFDGKLDDLQIYSGVLSSNEVAQLYANPGSTAADGGGSSGGHTNLAYYSFEDNSLFAYDFSGHGNNMGGYSWFSVPPYMTNDAAAGSYAVGYTGSGWQNPTTNLVATLAGSFSVSLWARTSDTPGTDSDDANSGAGLLAANADQVIPMALTGSKLAFLTGGGSPDTLHSATSINSGSYVHLVVTRDANSGAKKIYVNGSLDASGFGAAGPLSTSSTPVLFLGMNSQLSAGFRGNMDEVQIYSGVLSASEVAFLYNNPGTNVADTAGTGSDFNDALNTTGLTWTTGGDSNWFIQTTNTHDNVSAARSGAITDDTQTSYLETTVTGPGTLSFWWQTAADDFDFDLEFRIDGNYMDDIYGNTSWVQYSYDIPPGQHTLTWIALAYDFIPDTDAGYLDEVSFVSANAPVITLNPFNQTNYPGYNVALLAAATSNVAITWEWFKVGNASPIPNATNALFIPANSGTAGVAGSYYGVASTGFGSANTTTAAVSFINAPLPPDWSVAFKTPLNNNNPYVAVTNYAIACLLDSTGNLYSVNSFSGANTFGSDLLLSANDKFASSLLKQTASGTAIWGRGLTNNGNGSSYPQGLVRAPGDGVYMSGVFSGTNWLGTNRLVDISGASVYLARFDANGSNLWVRTFGGTNAVFQGRHQLVSDPAGNVTISALLNNTVSFGTTNVTVEGQKGGLIQYDANGDLRWLQLPSGSLESLNYSDGRIYGAMGGSETNYAGGQTNVSDRHWVLVALNATNGAAAWLRGIASHRDDYTLGDTPRIAVSGTNVFLVGAGAGSNAVFGPYSVSWPVSVGQYFARYDTNGTAQLATTFGSQTTILWDAAADASGNVYVGGDFDTYSIFGNDIIAAQAYDTLQAGIPGQTFLAKFDRNGNALWARQAQSTSSYVNLRDIMLANDGVWACGVVNLSASFGTYAVYGTEQCIGFPFCFIQYHGGGWLAKITEFDTSLVSVDLSLEIRRQQDATLGDYFVAFPYFNSITPAATGTTTNTVVSPTGKFRGEINVSGNRPSSFVLSSLAQVNTEFTNGPWSLYLNKGKATERLFQFNASVSGLTTNLLAAVRIITPTNGATGIPTNSPFQWFGPTNFSTLGVNKQKFDGTDQASSSLAVTATNWPSPPGLAVGTNRFSVTYTSNNFPGITFTVPVDASSQSVSNWVPHFNLFSTAASIFVVSIGSSPVLLVNPGVTATSFQFSFTSPNGVTNSIQYRTNLTAGSNWQTYSNVVGNGSLQTIQIPLSIFNPARQGFVRILMQ